MNSGIWLFEAAFEVRVDWATLPGPDKVIVERGPSAEILTGISPTSGPYRSLLFQCRYTALPSGQYERRFTSPLEELLLLALQRINE